jgi:NAD(P)H-hydrate epimerase
MTEPIIITRDYVRALLPKRRADSHKGTYGKVLIVAGSPGMAGAAILAGRSAFRSGAGLVAVSADQQLWTAIHSAVPEVTIIDRTLPTEKILSRDAVAIGPGLGTDIAAAQTLQKILGAPIRKIVIDADALNIIAEGSFGILNGCESLSAIKEKVITPHSGEAARLLGTSPEEINRNRERAALELAGKYDCVAVLKGNGTLVASPDGAIFENPTGNPGMATGGAGDVLTGVIVSLMGQGMSALDAAKGGVYIHGLAGDIAAKKTGAYGLLASDITETIPAAMISIQSIAVGAPRSY